MSESASDPASFPVVSPGLGSTAVLLRRVQNGDQEAREALFSRFLPLLRRWGHCRLPSGSRDLTDTEDLIQVTFIRALNRLPDLESRGEGTFLAYLRRILLNTVREEIRRSSRRGERHELTEELVADSIPPLERLIGRERMERYELGLSRLSPEQQQILMLRVEFDYTFGGIAEAMGKPSPNAARMTFVRAVLALAKAMNE